MKNEHHTFIFPLLPVTWADVLTYLSSTSLLQSVPHISSFKQRSQSVTLYSCRRLKMEVSFIAFAKFIFLVISYVFLICNILFSKLKNLKYAFYLSFLKLKVIFKTLSHDLASLSFRISPFMARFFEKRSFEAHFLGKCSVGVP